PASNYHILAVLPRPALAAPQRVVSARQTHNAAPPAAPAIAAARPIGEDINFRHRCHTPPGPRCHGENAASLNIRADPWAAPARRLSGSASHTNGSSESAARCRAPATATRRVPWH